MLDFFAAVGTLLGVVFGWVVVLVVGTAVYGICRVINGKLYAKGFWPYTWRRRK